MADKAACCAGDIAPPSPPAAGKHSLIGFRVVLSVRFFLSIRDARKFSTRRAQLPRDAEGCKCQSGARYVAVMARCSQ